jgi:hypothetical protein
MASAPHKSTSDDRNSRITEAPYWQDSNSYHGDTFEAMIQYNRVADSIKSSSNFRVNHRNAFTIDLYRAIRDDSKNGETARNHTKAKQVMDRAVKQMGIIDNTDFIARRMLMHSIHSLRKDMATASKINETPTANRPIVVDLDEMLQQLEAKGIRKSRQVEDVAKETEEQWERIMAIIEQPIDEEGHTWLTSIAIEVQTRLEEETTNGAMDAILATIESFLAARESEGIRNTKYGALLVTQHILQKILAGAHSPDYENLKNMDIPSLKDLEIRLGAQYWREEISRKRPV